jgi:AcrR family transcriptional regulator
MSAKPPRRDAAENRSAIIAAARTLLQQDPDASIETIAAEAGLSRRTVYGHFPSRDELVEQIVTLGAERILGAMPTAHDLADLAPASRLAVIAVALWHEVSHVRSMAQLAVRGPLMGRVAEVFAPLRANVRDACALGIADGSMRSDVDAARLARLVEGACLAVLDEAARSDTDGEYAVGDAEGARMVVLSALGMAGVDWRTADLAVPQQSGAAS